MLACVVKRFEWLLRLEKRYIMLFMEQLLQETSESVGVLTDKCPQEVCRKAANISF